MAAPAPEPRPIRIANFSGAVGDWLGALHAAVEGAARGEPVDVLTGDYLAEITMGSFAGGLAAAGQDPRGWSAEVFLRQIGPELAAIAEHGLRVVTNAGGFAPAAMAERLRAMIAEAGLDIPVAHVEGDDLFDLLGDLAESGAIAPLEPARPFAPLADRMLAASAYLGGWGIAAALAEGAQIVVTGRVSDASLALGPAAWWHGWARDDWDRLAGAVAAGHVIECGPQAMGGNFTGFLAHERAIRLGFPVAEIAADGSSVITKRAGEGGHVDVDTVTAQVLYEIQGPRYLNPDVVWHVDSTELALEGPDRVRMSGVRGSPPPPTTKLACFYPAGWRTTIWGFVTGADWREKADWLIAQMEAVGAALPLDDLHCDLLGRPGDDPATLAEATAAIRIGAAAQDPATLAALQAGYTSFGLGGIPGFHGDRGAPPHPRVEFWPGLVAQDLCAHAAVLEDGRRIAIDPPATTAPFPGQPPSAAANGEGVTPPDGIGEAIWADLVHARSGDKGGEADLGVWCRDPAHREWLEAALDEDSLRKALGLRQDVAVTRHLLPNLNGMLFVLDGYFGASGTGSVALDQIGKSLGEFLRARRVVADPAR